MKSVVFSVQADTQFGDEVYVSGSASPLGCWNVDNAPKLFHAEGAHGSTRGVWKSDPIQFQDDGLEYKYIVKKKDSNVYWEDRQNRSLDLLGQDLVFVCESWNTQERRLCERLPYAVLVGPVGSGKTTLAQKLTGKQGLTERRQHETTIFVTSSFLFADTPSFNPEKDKLTHAIHIVSALHYRPVSRIFVLCKFNEKDDVMVESIKNMVTALSASQDHLTILVTACKSNDRQSEIKQKFKESFKISSVCFLADTDTPADLELTLKNTFTNPVKVTIPTNELSKYFGLQESDEQVQANIEAKTSQFEELKKGIMDKQQDLADQEKLDFLHSGQVALKDTLIQLKQDFCAEMGFDLIDDPREFAFEAALHSRLMSSLKEFREYCLQFQTYLTGCDNEDTPMRKCPYCEQVWIKVEGCDGVTTCGARPSIYERRAFTKWTWQVDSGKLEWSREALDSAPALEIDESDNGGGCGQEIEWALMAPVIIPNEVVDTQLDNDDLVEAKINPSLSVAAKLKQTVVAIDF